MASERNLLSNGPLTENYNGEAWELKHRRRRAEVETQDSVLVPSRGLVLVVAVHRVQRGAPLVGVMYQVLCVQSHSGAFPISLGCSVLDT